MAKPGGQSEPLLPPPSYHATPPDPSYHQPEAYVLLPAYPRRRCCGSPFAPSTLLTAILAAALFAAALFFLWPSRPDLSVVRLRLDRVHVTASPAVALDVSLRLKVRVRNRDFFSFDSRSVVVSIGYRGRRLGSVTSDGGHVRARGVSYVDAKLRLDGIEVIHDAFYLLEDLVRGSIPFDTITEVKGQLHFLFFDIPVQGGVSCVVNVNPGNQTVVRQDCYPE